MEVVKTYLGKTVDNRIVHIFVISNGEVDGESYFTPCFSGEQLKWIEPELAMNMIKRFSA